MLVATWAILALHRGHFAEDPVVLIDEKLGVPMPDSWTIQGSRMSAPNAGVQKEKKKGKGRQVSNFLHLEFDAPPSHQFSDCFLRARSIAMVHLGDTVAIRVWMRGTGQVSLSYAQTVDPFAQLINETIKLTPAWKEYRFAATAQTQYLPGDAKFEMLLGYGAGTADISRLRVEDLGDDPPSSIHPTNLSEKHKSKN